MTNMHIFQSNLICWLQLLSETDPDILKINIQVVKNMIEFELEYKIKNDIFQKKIDRLHGYFITTSYDEFKEIFGFIAKHFYQMFITEEGMKDYWKSYIEDSPHTIHEKAEGELGNIHCERDEWDHVLEAVHDEIWATIHDDEVAQELNRKVFK